MRLFVLASALFLMSTPMVLAADHGMHNEAAPAVESGAVTVEKAQEIALAVQPGTVVSSAPDATNPTVQVFDIQTEDGTVVEVKVDTVTGQVVNGDAEAAHDGGHDHGHGHDHAE